MARSISHQDIFDAIDRRCNAERERIEAERDLARALVSTWLARQAGDQAGVVETSTRIVTPIALAQGAKRELSVKDLAALWGVSTRSIYEWKTTGGLRFKKVGRLLRFDPIEADLWALRHQESFTRAKLRVVK